MLTFTLQVNTSWIFVMEKLTYKPVSHDHEEFLRESKKGDMFRKEYEALGPIYAIIRELLLARKQSGLTQVAVARKIGTTKSAIVVF